MKVYPPVYVLRHGQTVWNAERRIQGGLDSPLTDLGRAQAHDQFQILKSCNLSGYSAFCSPQGRAFHTASLALNGLVQRICTDPRLVEIGVGRWEGQAREDLSFDRPVDESEESALQLYERAPDGEGFEALRHRCQEFLEELSGPSVLVTHGVTSRMLRLILTDRDTVEIGMISGGQGVVYSVENGVQQKLSIGA